MSVLNLYIGFYMHFYIYELLAPFYTSLLVSFLLFHQLFVYVTWMHSIYPFRLPPSDVLETLCLLNVQEFCESLARPLIA